jgi:cytochrome P450
MTMTDAGVYYDMYNRDILAYPYEIYRRLRDEAPLYYNPGYDFYLVSRFDDVMQVVCDRETFISGRGMSFPLLKSGAEMPEGLFICEDDPGHTIHRNLVSRLFTPRAISGLESQIRLLFSDVFDSVAGLERFDFQKDVAVKIPVQVIGMLIGLPKEDQVQLHEIAHESLNNPNSNMDHGMGEAAAFFNEYLDWREKNPTDDVMTQLLNVEFEDATGTRRRLRRGEIVTYLNLIVSAGSDTTASALGWAAKVLADYPDQRHELADDPSLIPNAAEEVLRYEPPSCNVGRFTTRDVEFYGQTVPADSIMMVVPGAANRDDRQFPYGDWFDIHRKPGTIFTFSFGTHFCLGAALARLELRIGMETLVQRYRDWTVDFDHATMTTSVDTRAWENLPVEIG